MMLDRKEQEMRPDLNRYADTRVSEDLWLIPDYELRAILVMAWKPLSEDVFVEPGEYRCRVNGIDGLAWEIRRLVSRAELAGFLSRYQMPDNFDDRGVLVYFEMDMGW